MAMTMTKPRDPIEHFLNMLASPMFPESANGFAEIKDL
jgi:hypothetical protein